MLKAPVLAVAAAVLAVALPASAVADPQVLPPRYGSNGTFGVGPQSRGQVTSFIPPGTYQPQLAPGFLVSGGFWLRCSNLPCAPTYPQNIIASGDTDGSGPIELLPTDTAVYLYRTTLNFVG